MGRRKETFADSKFNKRVLRERKKAVRDRLEKIRKEEENSGKADELKISQIEAKLTAMKLNPNGKEKRKARRQALEEKNEYRDELRKRLNEPSDGKGMITQFIEPKEPKPEEKPKKTRTENGVIPRKTTSNPTQIYEKKVPTHKMTPKEAAEAHIAMVAALQNAKQLLDKLPEEMEGMEETDGYEGENPTHDDDTHDSDEEDKNSTQTNINPNLGPVIGRP